MSLEELLQVVVTTSKTEESVLESPGVIEIITAQDIAAYGALSLGEVLDRSTSVMSVGSSVFPNNNMAVRGDVSLVDKHVLLLIDGRPFRESATGGQNFTIYASYPLAMVDRIEIVRGPGSVLYGTNAYSGIINIIPKRGKRLEAEAVARYGSFETAQSSVAAGGVLKDLQVFAAAQYLNRRGRRLNTIDAFGVLNSTRARELDIGVAGDVRYKGLSLNLLYAGSAQQSLVNQIAGPFAPLVGDRVFADLGYTRQFGRRWSASLNITHNYNQSSLPVRPVPDFLSGNNPSLRINSRDALAELSVSGELTKGLRLLVGGVADYQTGGSENPEAFPPPEQGADVITSLTPPYHWIWWSGYG
ncbi:MAG TPA: TonB-dependent receptor plug domain-containing protein, partial [Myxococcaceae bacterium]|nr:TonB-dependent receptor plug domain-containing protein [Myxococcaceae bacterium]